MSIKNKLYDNYNRQVYVAVVYPCIPILAFFFKTTKKATKHQEAYYSFYAYLRT